MVERTFEQLQREQIVQIKLEAVSLDSTSIRCIRRAPARRKGPQAICKSRGGSTAKIRRAATDARTAVAFLLSPGHAHAASEEGELPKRLGRPDVARTTMASRAVRPPSASRRFPKNQEKALR